MVFVSLFLIEESNFTKEEEKKLSGTRKRKLRDGLMFDGRRRKKEKKKKKKRRKKKKIKSFVPKEVCFSVMVHLIPKVLGFSMFHLDC